MEQAPVQIGQFILGKNLGIGAFGKVWIGIGKKHQQKSGIALRQYHRFARCFTRELKSFVDVVVC